MFHKTCLLIIDIEMCVCVSLRLHTKTIKIVSALKFKMIVWITDFCSDMKSRLARNSVQATNSKG